MPQHAIGQPGFVAGSGRQALERDRQLVQHLVAALVGARRRTARPDEPSGEEIGQTRVALPVSDERAQDLRPREEGTIGRRDAADRQSATTAGRKPPPVVGRHALRAQTETPGFLVRGAERTPQLVPVVCLGKVQAQHTSVRLEQEAAQARVLRRLVTLERDGELQRLGRNLHRCHEVEVVLEVRDGWQKHEQPTRARFDAQGRARRVVVTRACLGQAALVTRAHAGVEIGEASTRFERRALDSTPRARRLRHRSSRRAAGDSPWKRCPARDRARCDGNARRR